MTKTIDPITQADFDAYIDDQLLGARRIEVAGYLSEHPEEAARVMADLRGRDELRLALSLPALYLASPRHRPPSACSAVSFAAVFSTPCNGLRRLRYL